MALDGRQHQATGAVGGGNGFHDRGRYETATRRRSVGAGFLPVALMAGSVVLVGAAPWVVGDGYSMVEHTTSESAGQLVEGSWVARLGFVFFGFAVLVLARRRAAMWGRVGSFGVGMSFTLGVLIVGMRRGRDHGTARWFDVAAFVLAPGISLAMAASGDVDGVLQRVVFVIAYVWYGVEAVAVHRSPGREMLQARAGETS